MWKAANRDVVKAYARKFYREKRAKPQRAAVCELCGESFRTARADQRFCGTACGRKWHRRKSDQPWNDRRRAHYHRRRALKAGAEIGARVIPSEIYARDGGICGICGDPVGDADWPDPESGSMDHIVPLSAGGAHDPANVQLAHLGCNLAKGNRYVG